jgi:hypothetical protein
MESAPRFQAIKCGMLLQALLVEIRNLSFQEGNAKRINDLADLSHNIPEFLLGWNDYVLGYLREGMLDYCRRYHPDIAPETHRYVRLLDMDEATFEALYGERLTSGRLVAARDTAI